ncbi:MAG: DUF11 domain-containing protein [Deltaproteobacteria bacterium]|nr:DUF11 domain-containing protein [Deltaproteobacteria bacterium]
MKKGFFKSLSSLLLLTLFFLFPATSWAVFDVCIPGERECIDGGSFQECNDTGDGYKEPVTCGGDTEACFAGQCLELCEIAAVSDSSLGCSFLANRMDNFSISEESENNLHDTIVVGNFFSDKTATVQLYFTANGGNIEQAVGNPVEIAPETSSEFNLENDFIGDISLLRIGGAFRVESNIPVQAYLHSPLNAINSNDSSLLIPETSLKNDYVVASFESFSAEFNINDEMLMFDGYSFFNVIGLEDDTTVQFSPSVNTLGGDGVDAVTMGNTGSVNLNRFDTLQVRAEALGDVSGSLIQSDKPIWVIGANVCANIPVDETACDHIQESSMPVEFWSNQYVGTHNPLRGEEKHVWRVYAGADNVTITTEPAVDGTPVSLLNKGEFAELVLDNGTDVVFNGDGPFLPVQYLVSAGGVGEVIDGLAVGDPSMYQAIPVQQFLKRYAFKTGTETLNGPVYQIHFVQVVRPANGADIFIDGVVVNNYKNVGAFEVANVAVTEASHFANSEGAFGLANIGYGNFVSYAYPGGFIKKVQNSSNLLVNKEASNANVEFGEEFTYNITVENTGPQDEPNAILVDEVPAELEIVSVSPGEPTCTVNAQVVLCKLGEIKANDSASVDITVKVIEIPDNNLIINTAVAHGDKNNPNNNDDGLDGNPSDARGGSSEGTTTVLVSEATDDGGDTGEDAGDEGILEGSGNLCSLNAQSDFVGHGFLMMFVLGSLLYAMRLVSKKN